jgi:hypothetical protein
MKSKTFITLVAVITAVLFVAVSSFAQEMPAPGTTIDKSNYKKYAHLFPEEWAPAFEDGFGGLLPLFKMNVAATKQYPMPKAYLDYSAKNKGKYSLDANGNITPAFNREGLPFPDLQSSEKDFVTKLMYNYDNKYEGEVALDKGGGGSYEKRRGENVRYNSATSIWLFFKNRLVLSPKPDLPNPSGLYKTLIFHFIAPESIKNTITLSYRYVDQTKPDDTYLYLPALRRVLRAEAGQRSSPMVGSTNSLDDFNGFDGRTPEFTYTLVKEQKVLAVVDSKMTLQIAKGWKKTELPVDTDGYELRDSYVIDIKPKDSKYPQSRKRIYVDKETLHVSYAIAYDRAGKVWKVWLKDTKMWPLGTTGQQYSYINGFIGIDAQFGMATQYVPENSLNANDYTYADVTPQALLKRAR